MTFKKLTREKMKFISVATGRSYISVAMMEEMKNPTTVDIEYDRNEEKIKIFAPGIFKIIKEGNQTARLNVSFYKLMRKGRYVYKSTAEDGGFIFEKSIE